MSVANFTEHIPLLTYVKLIIILSIVSYYQK